MTFRSYLDGSTQFMGPETSMEVQAALGSDIALVFDECTPFHGGRDYTARSTERTHRWLDRCLDWHAQNGPEGQIVYGIVQGGVEEDLRRWSAQEVAARPVGGIAIGGTLGEDKDQMFEVVDWALQELDEERPRHLLGIGEIDDLVRGVELGIDTFDCAMPTRIGRHGMAVVPDPDHRWRVDLAKARYRDADEPLLEGCPCPACAHGYSRAYLHYLLKAREQTAQRLLTIHNLAYLQRLMAELRAAIDGGRLAETAGRDARGAAPWSTACCRRSGRAALRSSSPRCRGRPRGAAPTSSRCCRAPGSRRSRRRRARARRAGRRTVACPTPDFFLRRRRR